MIEKIGAFFASALSFVKDDSKAVIAICIIAAAVIVFLVSKGVITL